MNLVTATPTLTGARESKNDSSASLPGAQESTKDSGRGPLWRSPV